MNSIVIRQIIVVSCLVAILCIALLVGVPLILGSVAGTHPSQGGLMLIAPPYQIV
jgi:hypothetical protein